MTYGALAEAIRMVAGGFRRYGVQRGDCVALLCWNTAPWVVSYFALLGLGATVIPLNVRLKPPELAVILRDAGCRALVADAQFDETVMALLADQSVGLKQVWLVEGALTPPERWAGQMMRWEHLLLGDPIAEAAFPVAVQENTLATLIYTSGTTGAPKGVMLSHGNILADATANTAVIEATGDDVFVTVSPLFHVFGQTNILVTAMLSAATVVLVRQFNPRRIIQAVGEYGVTFLAAVPTMYQMMLNTLSETGDPLYADTLRVCHSGAAPMPAPVFEAIERVFGAPVQEGYGLSEATSIITSNPLQGVRKPGSVGLPLPGLKVCVLRPDLTETTTEEVGEIHVQGPVVMQGYFNQPEKTAGRMADGWLKTGDLAYRDADGYIYIVNRVDDLFKVGGNKVYPREVEDVLYQHPAVQAAAVCGRVDEAGHMRVHATLVPQGDVADEELWKNEIRQWCLSRLADYKVPRQMVLVTELPQGATGKILRRLL